MKIDISSLPLIDNHAHPFPSGRAENTPYERNFTLSRMPLRHESIHNTLVFQMLSLRLRRFLGLKEDCSIEVLDAERKRRRRNTRARGLVRHLRRAGS